jgi:hypothetical protein
LTFRYFRALAAGIAAAAVCATSSPSYAQSATLPERAAPAGMRSIDDAGGGRILIGGLGSVASGDTFRAGLRRIGAYFSHTMRLASVVRSNDGRITMTAFDARLSGVPVGGVALTSYGSGASRVAVVFDLSQRLPRTLGGLFTHLQSLPPPAASQRSAGSSPQRSSGASLQAQIAAVPTVQRTSNDGTVSVRLPADWQIKQFAEGSVVADGPDGAEVVEGLSFPMVDPRGPTGMGIRVPYDSDPARSYQTVFRALAQMSGQPATQFVSIHEKPVAAPAGINAAEVTGTSRQHGKVLRFDEFVGVGQQGPAGGWQVSVSGVVAPDDRFEIDEPAMGALFESYRLDNGRRQAQVQASIAAGWAASRAGIAHMNAVTAADQATVDASMQSARAVQDGIDRSTAGFVRYLNDSDVVAHASGAHLSVDAGTAQALTTFDPQHFRSVPVTQYVKGVDY